MGQLHDKFCDTPILSPCTCVANSVSFFASSKVLQFCGHLSYSGIFLSSLLGCCYLAFFEGQSKAVIGGCVWWPILMFCSTYQQSGKYFVSCKRSVQQFVKTVICNFIGSFRGIWVFWCAVYKFKVPFFEFRFLLYIPVKFALAILLNRGYSV